MTAILVAFFGTVAAVNVTMARLATGTFGGVVVANSYVASQQFNGWLGAAEGSAALGWQVDMARQVDGRVALTVAGAPDNLLASGTARHPLGREDLRELDFERLGEGRYLSAQPLPEGRWTLRLELANGSQVWRGEDELQ